MRIKNRRLKVGDVFKLNTCHGIVLIHYVFNHKSLGQLIEIIDGYYNKIPENLDEVVRNGGVYFVLFPVKGAYKRGFLEFVGNVKVDVEMPKFMRNEFYVKGEFCGWEIVNTETLVRDRFKILKDEHKKFSPWGVWGDSLLLEVLESSWKFSNWNEPSELKL